MRSKLGLRFVALFYLLAVLVGPVVMVFYRALEHGLGDFWSSISNAQAAHALWLTVLIALISRKSTRLNSSHSQQSRMPSSA